MLSEPFDLLTPACVFHDRPRAQSLEVFAVREHADAVIKRLEAVHNQQPSLLLSVLDELDDACLILAVPINHN